MKITLLGITNALTAIVTFFVTRKFYKEQIALLKRNNELLEKREEREVEDATKAEMTAVCKLKEIYQGKSRYKVFIRNQGKANARNVRFEFPEGDHWKILSLKHNKDKFPMNIIQPEQEIILDIPTLSSPKRKQKIQFWWEDDSGPRIGEPIDLTL